MLWIKGYYSYLQKALEMANKVLSEDHMPLWREISKRTEKTGVMQLVNNGYKWLGELGKSIEFKNGTKPVCIENVLSNTCKHHSLLW